jgi:hypothetical protein
MQQSIMLMHKVDGNQPFHLVYPRSLAESLYQQHLKQVTFAELVAQLLGFISLGSVARLDSLLVSDASNTAKSILTSPKFTSEWSTAER